jgi:hypothetical protein
MSQDDNGNEDEYGDTNKYVRLAPVAEGKGNNGVNTDTFLSRFSVADGTETKRSKGFLVGGAANLQEVNAGDLLITRDVTSLGYVHQGVPLPPIMTWHQMWMSTDVVSQYIAISSSWRLTAPAPWDTTLVNRILCCAILINVARMELLNKLHFYHL